MSAVKNPKLFLFLSQGNRTSVIFGHLYGGFFVTGLHHIHNVWFVWNWYWLTGNISLLSSYGSQTLRVHALPNGRTPPKSVCWLPASAVRSVILVVAMNPNFNDRLYLVDAVSGFIIMYASRESVDVFLLQICWRICSQNFTSLWKWSIIWDTVNSISVWRLHRCMITNHLIASCAVFCLMVRLVPSTAQMELRCLLKISQSISRHQAVRVLVVNRNYSSSKLARVQRNR